MHALGLLAPMRGAYLLTASKQRAGTDAAAAALCARARAHPSRNWPHRATAPAHGRRDTADAERVELFTDGAALPRQSGGPGGWGALLRFGEREKELSGGEAQTTNNRMELMAAIAGLEALKRACAVVLTTDSQYVKRGVEEMDGALARERLAHQRQEAGEETRTCGNACPPRSPTTV